ncbi:hypothetical protein JXQ70_13765 [bacterium]|nr:hypothetical protein [bacterium]
MKTSRDHTRLWVCSAGLSLGLIWLGMLLILLTGGINLRDYGLPLAIHRLIKPLLLYDFILVLVFFASIYKRQILEIPALFHPKANRTDLIVPESTAASLTFPEMIVIALIWLLLTAGPLLELAALFGHLHQIILLVIVPVCALAIFLWHGWAVRSSLIGTGYNLRSNFRDTLIMICLLLIIWLGLCPAYTWIIGGRDPGVYVNIASETARTGTFRITNTILTALPDPEKQLFFGTTPYNMLHPAWQTVVNSLNPSATTGSFGIQFPGFYITNPEHGTITPQFLPYYSTLMALCLRLFGFPDGLNLTPALAGTALLLLYFLMRLQFGWSAAVIAPALLVANCGFYWFAKIPNSESIVLVQFLIMLYALARYQLSPHSCWLLMSTLACAEMFWARIDTILIMPAIVIWSVYSFSLKNRRTSLFWLLLFSLIGSSAFIALKWCSVYTHDVLCSLVHFQDRTTLLFFLVSFALFVLALGRYFRTSLLNWIQHIQPYFPAISLGLACVILYYGLMIRPTQTGLETNAWNMVKLIWYFNPFSILCAIFGLCLLNHKIKNYTVLLLLIVGYTYMFFYLYDAHKTVPDHYYWFRRFLSFTSPLLVIAAGYFLSVVVRFGGYGRVLGWGLAGLCIIIGLQSQQFLWDHRENERFAEDVKTIAEATQPEDIIIFPHYYYGLETPLQYVFNRQVLILDVDQVRQPHQIELVRGRFKNWHDAGRRVYAYAPPGHALISNQVLPFEQLKRITVERREVEKPLDRLPQRVKKTAKGFVLAEYVPQ